MYRGGAPKLGLGGGDTGVSPCDRALSLVSAKALLSEFGSLTCLNLHYHSGPNFKAVSLIFNGLAVVVLCYRKIIRDIRCVH